MAQAIREKGTAVRAMKKNLVGLQAMLHSIVFRDSHRQHAAIVIQHWWRTTLSRRVDWLGDLLHFAGDVFREAQVCARAVQSMYRGFKGRMFVMKLRAELREKEAAALRYEEQVEAAAIMVQRHIRGRQGRKRMKELRKGMEGRLMEASQPGTWLAGASQTSLLPGPDVMAAVEIQRTKAAGMRAEKEERAHDADHAPRSRPGKHGHGRAVGAHREEAEARRHRAERRPGGSPKRSHVAADDRTSPDLYARSKELTQAQKKKRGVRMKKDGKLVDGDALKTVQANASGLFDMGTVNAFETLQRNLLFTPLALDAPGAAPAPGQGRYADLAAGIFPVHFKP